MSYDEEKVKQLEYEESIQLKKVSTIPTAEEILINYGWKKDIPGFTSLLWSMKKFAKLHIEAALKAAAENAKVWVDNDPVPFGGPFKGVYPDSILNSYPLENIK